MSSGDREESHLLDTVAVGEVTDLETALESLKIEVRSGQYDHAPDLGLRAALCSMCQLLLPIHSCPFCQVDPKLLS